jgi:hypothetical protein
MAPWKPRAPGHSHLQDDDRPARLETNGRVRRVPEEQSPVKRSVLSTGQVGLTDEDPSRDFVPFPWVWYSGRETLEIGLRPVATEEGHEYSP